MHEEDREKYFPFADDNNVLYTLIYKNDPVNDGIKNMCACEK